MTFYKETMDRSESDAIATERLVELELVEDTGPLLSRESKGFEPVGLSDEVIHSALYKINDNYWPDSKKDKHFRGAYTVKPMSEWEPLLMSVLVRNEIVDMSNEDEVDEVVARSNRSSEIISEVDEFKASQDTDSLIDGYEHYLHQGFSHQDLIDAAAENADAVDMIMKTRLLSNRQVLDQQIAEIGKPDVLIALQRLQDEGGHFVQNIVDQAMLRAKLMILIEAGDID